MPDTETPKHNPFVRIRTFLAGAIAELRRTKWPTRHETLTSTGVMCAFVLVLGGSVALLDLGFGHLAHAIF